MKKKIIYSLLLVVAVLFAGCEDRLDIAKHGNMGGQDDFYKTNEQTIYDILFHNFLILYSVSYMNLQTLELQVEAHHYLP